MKRRPAKSLSAPRRGSVLIVVLWASVGLVSIALLFGHSMAMTYRGADNDLSGRQAEQAIDGAIRYVESLYVDAETPGTFPDITTYEGEALQVGEASFWLLGRPEDFGSGTTREFAIVDEASKLNLNAQDLTKEMLMYLPGMTDDLAAAILDWRSPDGGTSANGGINAEEVKHGPFESVEELALVTGMTREILYGEDANLNGVLDTNEDDGDRSLPTDNSDGKLDPGILEYLTVFSKEPENNPDGNPRIDVSTSEGFQQFRNRLAEWFPDRADEIRDKLGTTLPTSVLDLLHRGGLTAEEAETIADEVRGPIIDGLVNLNTASETVLGALLEDADKAAELVSERLNRAEQTRDMTWAIDALGEEGIAKAGKFLTGSSYQVSADVAAVGRHGRGYRRSRVVIDTSSGTPKVVYRRNLAPLGWALGRDIRQNLALKKEVR